MLKRMISQICYEAPADGGGTPPPAAPPAGPWYAGKADAELVGHWQNRGWADKSPEDVAIEASKAHREAQKLIGAPENQIIRLPANATDSEAMNRVWQRLGKPSDAKEYDFSGVKRAGDKDLDPALADALRNGAFQANMPKDAAQALAKAVVKHLDDRESAALTDRQVKLQEERDVLAKNWGQNAVANKLVAQNAVRALGLDPAVVDTLEGVLGYSKVMEMFRDIGTKIGEDRFVNSGTPGSKGVMSREQAVARKAELMADRDWSARYLSGNTEAGREMQSLNKIIVGET